MNKLSKIHTGALSLAFIAVTGSLNAQTTKPLETRTDEKYGNTTIVYRNDKGTSDAVILSQIEKEYGMGDVVRIAEAPPKPPVAPALAQTEVTKPTANKVVATPVKAVAKQENMASQSTKPAAVVSVTEKNTTVPQLVASDDPSVVLKSITAAPTRAAREYSDATQKPKATQGEIFKDAAPAVVKTSAAKTGAVKPAAQSANSAPKTNPVKTTGKLYKHKKKSGFKLNLNLLPKGGKQSYRCYKF